MKNEYPYMQLGFEADNCFGREALKQIMSYILPPSFFEGEAVEMRFQQQLPIISWTPLGDPPFDITFFLCCRFRANAFRFFYEMICRWLIPGKRLNALLQFAADFSIPEIGPEKYIGGVVRLRVKNARELETIQRNLPIVEQELRLGLESYYQACRILEIKGLSSDEKTALIQENIVSLIRHRPQDFDYDILSEMQHFLVICKEEFKEERTYRHMSRIICVLYLFRRALKLSLESFPDRRYVSVKLVRAKLLGKRPILGITIGFSFIRNNELFEERHILSGVQALLPGVNMVAGSFFRHQGRSDPICTLYLEVEKADGISLEEERLLKEELPSELKNRFEQRLNPIFMPQNEEMVIRNIVALSNQLKYVRDLPQALVDFHQQTEENLEFLVIMLRIVRPGLPDIAACFENKPTFLEFVPDRKKIVGTLRKKYQKEANVFLVRIRKDPFLRKNQSVDLYKARKSVAIELARLVGEFRDYNGGTISKECELFDQLKEELGERAAENAFLLENFFYSLSPPVMRSILPVDPIKKLFHMLLEEQLVDDQNYTICIQEDSNYLYALITSTDSRFHEALNLNELEEECVSCFVPQTDSYSYGLICLNATPERSLKIRLAIEELMAVK